MGSRPQMAPQPTRRASPPSSPGDPGPGQHFPHAPGPLSLRHLLSRLQSRIVHTAMQQRLRSDSDQYRILSRKYGNYCDLTA
jgi:hypothetical protein